MTGEPFEILRGLLTPYEARLIVKRNENTSYYLERCEPSGEMFAAVQVKKSYTSFHLYPVYLDPSLLDGASPTLLKRMQGKSCFNFSRAEQVPVAELAALISRAFQRGAEGNAE